VRGMRAVSFFRLDENPPGAGVWATGNGSAENAGDADGDEKTSGEVRT